MGVKYQLKTQFNLLCKILLLIGKINGDNFEILKINYDLINYFNRQNLIVDNYVKHKTMSFSIFIFLSGLFFIILVFRDFFLFFMFLYFFDFFLFLHFYLLLLFNFLIFLILLYLIFLLAFLILYH